MRLEPGENSLIGPIRLVPKQDGHIKLHSLRCEIFGLLYEYPLAIEDMVVLKAQPKLVLCEASNPLKSLFLYEGEQYYHC